MISKWSTLALALCLSVAQSQDFVRDDSIPLTDQLNNPGGLILGPRAWTFGATDNHLGHAFFPDIDHGLAALIDLIRAWDGDTIETYMLSNNGYSGGNEEVGSMYLDVFEDKGISRDAVIDKNNSDMTYAMMLVHLHTEGGKRIISEQQFASALALQRKLSQ